MGPTIGDKQTEARELADELLGTSDNLPEHIVEDFDLCDFLDELVFVCEDCGLWADTGEADDAGNCGDCCAR